MVDKSPKEPGGYDVGYGKPPKSGQFKKGHKGFGPKAKGPPKLEDIIAAEAARMITATLDGQAQKLPKIDVVVKALFQKAMKGDTRAIQIVLTGVGALPPAPEAEAKVTAGDLQLLQEIIAAKLAGEEEDPQ